jgi:glycosyltransferase involved in cell wall biosynthesis
MPRLSVCMLSASIAPARGGSEGQCLLLSRYLAGKGVAVSLLTQWERGAAGFAGPSLHVHRLPARGGGLLAGLGYVLLCACWLAARGARHTILHAHQALSPALAATLAKRLRPRFRVVVKVACSGAWSDFRLAQARPFFRRRLALLRGVDRFVVLNPESAAEVEALGLDGGRTVRIPNGVDSGRFMPALGAKRQALRRRLGLGAEERVALFVGRLEARKGVDVLLRAWARLAEPGLAPRLLLAGAGATAQWAGMVRSLGLDEKVVFLGERQDVADLHRAADVFVFPSRAEGCPNAVLEAMASALPVVATDVAGNREALGDKGDAGILVPGEDPERLAQALRALAASPALGREMGAAARRRILERFDIRLVGEEYLSLYRSLEE